MFHLIRNLAQLFPNEENLLRISAGKELYHEGSTDGHAFVVKYGVVEISRGGRLTEVGEAGCLLGEESIVNSSQKKSTVKVVSDCGLVPIDQAKFDKLVKQVPGFHSHVMRVLEGRTP